MPIAITCPSCKHSGRVPDTALGRRIKCPKCATPFLVEADGAAPLRPVPPPSVGEPASPTAPEPPAPPSLHQQPLPSAFDLPAEPAPEPPAPPPADSPADSDDHDSTDAPVPTGLPWFYGFLETYTRVAMIAGIAVATTWLLFYLGLSVLTVVGTQGQGIVVAAALIVAASSVSPWRCWGFSSVPPSFSCWWTWPRTCARCGGRFRIAASTGLDPGNDCRHRVCSW